MLSQHYLLLVFCCTATSLNTMDNWTSVNKEFVTQQSVNAEAWPLDPESPATIRSQEHCRQSLHELATAVDDQGLGRTHAIQADSLIKAGADMRKRDNRKMTPIEIAIHNNKTLVLVTFIKHGATVKEVCPCLDICPEAAEKLAQNLKTHNRHLLEDKRHEDWKEWAENR